MVDELVVAALRSFHRDPAPERVPALHRVLLRAGALPLPALERMLWAPQPRYAMAEVLGEPRGVRAALAYELRGRLSEAEDPVEFVQIAELLAQRDVLPFFVDLVLEDAFAELIVAWTEFSPHESAMAPAKALFADGRASRVARGLRLVRALGQGPQTQRSRIRIPSRRWGARGSSGLADLKRRGLPPASRNQR